MTRYRDKVANAENEVDKELCSLRGLCHKHFDPGWKIKYRGGPLNRWPNRSAAYFWLQNVMELSSEKAHISLFNQQQCLKLLKILGVYRDSH